MNNVGPPPHLKMTRQNQVANNDTKRTRECSVKTCHTLPQFVWLATAWHNTAPIPDGSQLPPIRSIDKSQSLTDCLDSTCSACHLTKMLPHMLLGMTLTHATHARAEQSYPRIHGRIAQKARGTVNGDSKTKNTTHHATEERMHNQKQLDKRQSDIRDPCFGKKRRGHKTNNGACVTI